MNLVDCTETLRLVYDRGNDGYGVPVPGVRFKGTQDLYDALDGIRKDLKVIGWLPYIDSVLTAGLYVNKKGAHGDGNAWDFDGVILKKIPLSPQFSTTKIYVYKTMRLQLRKDGMLIIASMQDRIKTRLACLFSLRFPTVLTAGYNAAHEDHMHLSIAGEVGWRGSRSQVILVQETLNAWYDAGLVVDGVFGKKTLYEWDNAIPSGKDIAFLWLEWLKRIAFDPPKDGV